VQNAAKNLLYNSQTSWSKSSNSPRNDPFEKYSQIQPASKIKNNKKPVQTPEELIKFCEMNQDRQDIDNEANAHGKIMQILSQEIVYNGKSYGKPIHIGSQYWLTEDFEVKAGIESLKINGIPNWRLPRKEELQELVDLANENPELFKDKANGFGAEPKTVYMSSTKANPEKLNGSDAGAWDFYGFSTEAQPGKYAIVPINSYFVKDPQKTRLVFDLLLLIPDLCEEQRSAFFYSPIADKNVSWDFGDGTPVSNEENPRHKFVKEGEYQVKYTAKYENGKEKMICKKIRVIPKIIKFDPLIINGYNYGCPILIADQTWLDQDLIEYTDNEGKKYSLQRGKGPGEKGENSWDYSKQACPEGWRLPTKSEIESLLKIAGKTPEQRLQFLKYKNGFNAQTTPDGSALFCGSEINGNTAWSLQLTSLDAKVGACWRWPNSGTMFSTRCISSSGLDLRIIPNINTVLLGESVDFSCDLSQHIVDYEWSFKDTNEKVKALDVSHIFKNAGEAEIILTVTLSTKRQISQSKKIWVANAAKFGMPVQMYGENYGQKIVIGEQVWMTQDFRNYQINNESRCLIRGKGPGTNGENSYEFTCEAVPKGWRLPTMLECEDLMKLAGNTLEQRYDFFTKHDGFNCIPENSNYKDAIFATSTQSEKNIACALSIKKGEIQMSKIWKYANSNANYSTRYIATDDKKLNILPESSALIVGKEYNFECLDTDNITTVKWSFGDNTFSKGQKVSHIYPKPAEYDMVIIAYTRTGFKIIVHRKIWVNYCTVQSEDEIIDGINYGKPVLLGNQVWISRDVEFGYNNDKKISLIRDKGPGEKGENSYSDSLICAPLGWRLPTKADITELLSWAGSKMSQKVDFLLSEEAFNAKISNIKGNAIFVGKDYTENVSHGFMIANNEVKLHDVWKYANSGASFSTRYIAENNATIDFHWPHCDVIVNQPFVIKCKHNNGYKSIRWNATDNPGSTDVSPKFVFKKSGKKAIVLNAIRNDGSILHYEHEIWCNPCLLSNADTKFDISKIRLIKFADYAMPKNAVHFTESYAPVAPYLEGSGGYVAFVDKQKHTMVCKFEDTKEMNDITEVCDVGEYTPCDIVSTSDGFAILVQNNEKCSIYLKGFTSDGEKVFSVTLINNGDKPLKPTDQIMFYETKDELCFGMKIMYNPSGGRLAYVKGRIVVSFAHYNHFGMKNGERDDHTGNTFISFDDNGKDPKLAYSWGASHSLRENILYNGENVIVTCLGDAFPHGIRSYICSPNITTDQIDPKWKTKNRLVFKSVELVEKLIGDGHGRSSGRNGALMQIGDFYYLPYSSKKGEYLFQGKPPASKTELDEFALLKFDSKLKLVNKFVFGPGNNILAINSARYGKNILIFWMESKKVDGGLYYFAHLEGTYYVMLVDENGKILTPKKELPMGFAPADDIRTLENGTVIWATEGKGKELMLAVLDVH